MTRKYPLFGKAGYDTEHSCPPLSNVCVEFSRFITNALTAFINPTSGGRYVVVDPGPFFRP